MANIPPDLWDELGEELAEVVIPFSERVYLESAERLLETVPIGVGWSLVNESASNWALQYGSELVRGINGTTRQATNQAISNFFTQGWTMGDLRGRLGRIYSPVRAEMIAVTEVTRAAVEGERATVREIEKEGIRMKPIFNTSNDDLVCPICSPRNQKEITDGQYPPLHPRCRCWLNHEFI
jgi:hypothetical protein